MGSPKVEHLQRIYRASLQDFVSTRNEVADEVRPKDPETADAIRKLKKPTVALWVVDQLAAQEPELIEKLTSTGSVLRAAVEDADPGDLTTALRDRKVVIRDLTRAAGALLAEGGHPATQQTLEKVSRILLMASADAAAAEKLRIGVLDSEPEASFDELAFVSMAPLEATDVAATDPTDDLKKSVAEAERTASKLELEADAAESEARQARRTATEARAEADRLAAKLRAGNGS